MAYPLASVRPRRRSRALLARAAILGSDAVHEGRQIVGGRDHGANHESESLNGWQGHTAIMSSDCGESVSMSGWTITSQR